MFRLTVTTALGLLFLSLAGQKTMFAETIYGTEYTANSELLATFDSAAPGSILASHTISGLPPNDAIAQIDVRPANGKLYGVARSGIYQIEPSTGSATLTVPIDLGSPIGGADFDPVTDRLRIATRYSPRNVLINVDTGQVIEQGSLHFAPLDPQQTLTPYILDIAYSNNHAGAIDTTLYAVTPANFAPGEALDSIDPTTGTLHTIGLMNLVGGSGGGFDISGSTGIAYYGTLSASNNPFYQVNLQTGQATLLGSVGGSVQGLSGIAVAPVPEPETYLLLTAGLAVITVARLKKGPCMKNARA